MTYITNKRKLKFKNNLFPRAKSKYNIYLINKYIE